MRNIIPLFLLAIGFSVSTLPAEDKPSKIRDSPTRHLMLVGNQNYYSSVSFDDLKDTDAKREIVSVDQLSRYFESALNKVDEMFGADFSKGVKVNPSVYFSYKERDGKKRWYVSVIVVNSKADNVSDSSSFHVAMSLDGTPFPIKKQGE